MLVYSMLLQNKFAQRSIACGYEQELSKDLHLTICIDILVGRKRHHNRRQCH